MSAAVRPIVTRKGGEHTLTGQSGGAVRISGVSPQHTPATKIWFGKVSNEPSFILTAPPRRGRDGRLRL